MAHPLVPLRFDLLHRLMVLLACFALAACGGGGNGETGGSDGDSPNQEVGVIAFLAFQGADPFTSLWAATDDGSALNRLDDPIASPGPGSFQVSPDRASVAYLHRSQGGLPGLYVTDTAGVTRTEVSGNPEASATISRFAWSPDSQHLAFVSDQATAGTVNPQSAIYVVDADGNNLRAISQGIADMVDKPLWSPDGRYVAMERSTVAGGDYQFAVYDIEADALVPAINADAAGNLNLKEFGTVAWSPDSGRIAYLLDRDTDGKIELYISTIDGAMTVKPHPTLAGSVHSFAWRPGTGARIAYVAEQLQDGFGPISELFTSAADGSDDRKEHPDLSAGTLDVKTFAWSPDGQHIAYSRDQTLVGVTDLFVNTKSGDQPVAQFEFTTSDLTSFQWSLDSQELIYRSRSVNGFPASLWSVSRTGFNNHRIGFPNPSPLNGPTTNTAPIIFSELSPLQPLLAYSVNIGSDSFEELYVNASSGGSEERFNPNVEPGHATETIFRIEWSPVSTTLAYLLEVDGTSRQLHAGIPGGNEPVKLSGDLNVVFSDGFEPAY